MDETHSSLGTHELFLHGDVALVRLHGEVTLPHIVAFYAQFHEVHRQHGQFSLIADVREGSTIAPEARRYAGKNRFGSKLTCVAVMGVGPVMRTIITMIMRSTTLLSPTIELPPMRFVSTEREAWDLVAHIKQTREQA